jgi:hypothetical protein
MSTAAHLTVAPGGSGTATHRCDFCNADTPRWSYPAPDLYLLAVEDGSVADAVDSCGGWSACDRCLTLIQRGDLAGLVQRVARESAGEFRAAGLGRKGARRYLRDLYGQLLPKLGAPMPITADHLTAWQAAMQHYREDDEASSQRVAAAMVWGRAS